MKSASLAAAVTVLAACSSPPSASTPSLSDLTLTPTATPGSSEVGTFQITNAAGFSGLTLELQVTAPGARTPALESAPLAVEGAGGGAVATGQVLLDLPANAASGMYAVALSVSDGTYASNTLTGSFEVN